MPEPLSGAPGAVSGAARAHRTLVLHGQLAAVWQLLEDGVIESFHFTAQPGALPDNNRMHSHVVTRPGDAGYEDTLAFIRRPPADSG